MIVALALLFAAGACLLGGWTLRLVRRDRLYVGYGIVVLFGLGASVLFVSLVPLLARPTPPLMAIGAITALMADLLLIYILSQLSVLSNRLTRLVQELALDDVSNAHHGPPPEGPDAPANRSPHELRRV